MLARDGDLCYLCGDFADQVDHVIAGDNHDETNLAAICSRCHQAKTIAERTRP